MTGEIIESEPGSDRDECRNGRLACAGLVAFDLSCEFPVPICQQCAKEAAGFTGEP